MNEEYDQMMLLEEMESLREILGEMQCQTRSDVEGYFATHGDPSTCDILDWMDHLNVSSLTELDQRITTSHATLDVQA